MFIWLLDRLKAKDYLHYLNNDDFIVDFLGYLDDTYLAGLPDFSEITNNTGLVNKIVEQTSNEQVHPTAIFPTYIMDAIEANGLFYEKYECDLTKMIKKVDIHHCEPSCFIKGICRHGFSGKGKPLIPSTFISNAGIIHMKRNHPFVNQNVAELTVTMRCNNNAQPIAPNDNKSSLATLYYTTNYITKSPLSTYDTYSIAVKAYERITSTDINSDNNTKFKKLFTNMFNILASEAEYSGPEIAHMIFNRGKNGTHYCTDNFKTLNFWDFYRYINANLENEIENPSIPLIIDNEINTDYYNYKQDYFYRNEHLENISLYEFICCYRKDSKKTANQIRFDFLPCHVQSISHTMSKIRKENVPVYLGPSWPRKNDEKLVSEYSKIILGKYIPFNKKFYFS
jgi:hypothetical protein